MPTSDPEFHDHPRRLRPSEEADVYKVTAPNLISPYEKKFYYHGISADPPPLLWRSDISTRPFSTPEPRARFFNVPVKTAHGVVNTPLNAVSHLVAPKIILSMKASGLQYSALKTARFSIAGDYGESSRGPVVVWIAVRPNTTDAGGVRSATPAILDILAEENITDVVVEWYVGSIERLGGPPLMGVKRTSSPRFGLTHPFNIGLGIPIFRQVDGAEGTLTFLFREVRRDGMPSKRILVVTCKHVASLDTTTDYKHDGNDSVILVCGEHRLSRALCEIKTAVEQATSEAKEASSIIAELESQTEKGEEDESWIALTYPQNRSKKMLLISRHSTPKFNAIGRIRRIGNSGL